MWKRDFKTRRTTKCGPKHRLRNLNKTSQHVNHFARRTFSHDVETDVSRRTHTSHAHTFYAFIHRPTWAKKIIKTLRPIYLIFIIFMFTFGIYVNLYIFRLFTPFLVLAGCLLPWVGFALGGLVAFLLRQPMDRIKTIAIETGIQNSGESE